MLNVDVLFRRLGRWLRNALPGPTMASRLARQVGRWRHLPPHQRASAYAQHVHVQQQLRQHHLQQKLAPKIVDGLWYVLKEHLKAPLGQLILLALLGALLGWW